ncbi:helix-turn-helix transcriptional regulator [Candidatus Gracilibacteria bacterium]|nr:helix-turn-helix transcriptional regulator [Candidatus Gracilibacteria bacterium]
MTPEKIKQVCPVIQLMGDISKKWTLIILKAIMSGSTSYSDIEKQVSDINPSILSSRLKDLQDMGFIDKNIVSSSPVKIEYQLTKKGKSFEPVLENISSWAMDNK